MKRILSIGVFVVLIAAVFWWLRDDLKVVFSIFRERLTFPIAAEILFFTVICYVNEPIRWLFILRNRFPSVSFSKLYHLLAASALISYSFPAHSGIPARLFMAKRILAVDFVTLGTLLAVDAALAYGSWLIVAVSGGFVLLPQQNVVSMVLGMVVIAFCLIVFYSFPRIDWSRITRFKRLSDFATNFSIGLKMITVRVGLINVLLIFCDIFFFGVRHTLILQSLGIQCSLVSVTFIVAISIFAGFVSFMPLGLGGYDLSLVFLLTSIGVPKEMALVVPIIDRIAMIGVGSVLGVISMNYISISQEKPLGYSGKSKFIDKVE